MRATEIAGRLLLLERERDEVSAALDAQRREFASARASYEAELASAHAERESAHKSAAELSALALQRDIDFSARLERALLETRSLHEQDLTRFARERAAATAAFNERAAVLERELDEERAHGVRNASRFAEELAAASAASEEKAALLERRLDEEQLQRTREASLFNEERAVASAAAADAVESAERERDEVARLMTVVAVLEHERDAAVVAAATAESRLVSNAAAASANREADAAGIRLRDARLAELATRWGDCQTELERLRALEAAMRQSGREEQQSLDSAATAEVARLRLALRAAENDLEEARSALLRERDTSEVEMRHLRASRDSAVADAAANAASAAEAAVRASGPSPRTYAPAEMLDPPPAVQPRPRQRSLSLPAEADVALPRLSDDTAGALFVPLDDSEPTWALLIPSHIESQVIDTSGLSAGANSFLFTVSPDRSPERGSDEGGAPPRSMSPPRQSPLRASINALASTYARADRAVGRAVGDALMSTGRRVWGAFQTDEE
jgi:hypothetical protein